MAEKKATITKDEKDRKKKLAYTLFVENGFEQKVIAEITGISENSISRWKKDGDWQMDREELTAGTENTRLRLLKQMNGLLKQIDQRKPGENVASPAEANTLAQYSASLEKLQTSLSFANKAYAGKLFISYTQEVYGQEKAIEILEIWHEFIMHKK